MMVDSETTATDVTELAKRLHAALTVLILRSRRRDGGLAAIGDLTTAQLSILLTVLDQGPIRVTRLAAVERVRIPTTSVAVRRLERQGLLKRKRDSANLRSVLVGITRKGIAQQRTSLAIREVTAVAQLRQLSQADRDLLVKALTPLERLSALADCRTSATADSE
jgi:DNA-binding MarR family transcriptional regulator